MVAPEIKKPLAPQMVRADEAARAALDPVTRTASGSVASTVSSLPGPGSLSLPIAVGGLVIFARNESLSPQESPRDPVQPDRTVITPVVAIKRAAPPQPDPDAELPTDFRVGRPDDRRRTHPDGL